MAEPLFKSCCLLWSWEGMESMNLSLQMLQLLFPLTELSPSSSTVGLETNAISEAFLDSGHHPEWHIPPLPSHPHPSILLSSLWHFSLPPYIRVLCLHGFLPLSVVGFLKERPYLIILQALFSQYSREMFIPQLTGINVSKCFVNYKAKVTVTSFSYP